MIRKEVPSAEVSGTETRRRSGAFKIKINGKVVYDKLYYHAWPYFEDVVAVVKKVANGKSPDKCVVRPKFDLI
jgi:selT/selW/selH-like putative selenoprotein